MMPKSIEDLEVDVERPEHGKAADERLHIALAKATKNNAFIRLTSPIKAMLIEYRERSEKVPGRRIQTLNEHKNIYLAITNGQPKKAAEAMTYHLNKLEEMMRKVENMD